MPSAVVTSGGSSPGGGLFGPRYPDFPRVFPPGVPQHVVLKVIVIAVMDFRNNGPAAQAAEHREALLAAARPNASELTAAAGRSAALTALGGRGFPLATLEPAALARLDATTRASLGLDLPAGGPVAHDC